MRGRVEQIGSTSVHSEIPTPMQWHARALADLERVRTAENRLVGAMGAGETAVRAAADEVRVATRDAVAWLVANPMADPALAARVQRMGKAYEALDRGARELAAYPGLEPTEARDRMRDLMSVVDFQSEKLNPWL